MGRYFVAQDPHGYWYCLPVDKKDTWERLLVNPDFFNYDAWDSMVTHRTDIDKLTFENPSVK